MLNISLFYKYKYILYNIIFVIYIIINHLLILYDAQIIFMMTFIVLKYTYMPASHGDKWLIPLPVEFWEFLVV